MRILIIDTYYEFFLRQFYARRRELRRLPYAEHFAALMAYRFSSSDAYSSAFKEYGWEAQEIIFNDVYLQSKWARENGLKTAALPGFFSKALNAAAGIDWRFTVLKEQVRQFRPDVIYIKEQSLLTDDMVRELKSMTRITAMQSGSRLLARRTYRHIDLAFTSLPHFVPRFRDMGLKSFYLKLCFDRRVLEQIVPGERRYDLTFAGGISFGQHKERNRLLETACREFPLKWFGYTTSPWNQSRTLKKCRQGPAWGLDLYRVLADSRITINIHGEISKQYANNVRLYEAAGMGACLLTEWKENLPDLFKPDEEVVTYRDEGEFREKLAYLLASPSVCEKIGRAGQKKTLNLHKYSDRVRELMKIFSEHMK